MKPYLTYTAEDLACDEDFLNWVKSPESQPHLASFWGQWLSEHPDRQELVDEARCLVLAVLAEDEYFPNDFKQQAVWNRIQISANLPLSAVVIPLWKRWYSRAAVAIFCLSLGWLVYGRTNPEVAETKTGLTETLFAKHVNNAESAQTIVLSDGTSITMQPHAVLEYPETFATDVREVSLAGEAFFEVKHDSDRPFLVRSGDIMTRVLGTSFTVRNVDEEKNVVVKVRTGKVSVFMASERLRPDLAVEKNVDGVVLMPNQQVLYEKDAMKMSKSLVENPSVLIPLNRQNFEFVDAPLDQVFQAIEEAYGVEIVFDEAAMSSCYLNASLDEVPLYDKLKLICKGVNASYEIMDSHIIIYGKGCHEDIENPNPY
jgi:ferric-dicitrate binding protein FerR (iron transport regulator)